MAALRARRVAAGSKLASTAGASAAKMARPVSVNLPFAPRRLQQGQCRPGHGQQGTAGQANLDESTSAHGVQCCIIGQDLAVEGHN
jgi:hypothetical protein